MKYTWEKDKNVEWWQHDEFDSIEDCIADAKENYLIAVGDTIAVGIVEPWELWVDAEMVLERLSEEAYEECGDAAESWEPYNASPEALTDLSEQLTECIKKWLKNGRDMPYFYKIADVVTVEVI